MRRPSSLSETDVEKVKSADESSTSFHFDADLSLLFSFNLRACLLLSLLALLPNRFSIQIQRTKEGDSLSSTGCAAFSELVESIRVDKEGSDFSWFRLIQIMG